VLVNTWYAILDAIEARPHSFAALLIVCSFTGIVRAVEEYLFFGERLIPAMGVAMIFAYFHIALGLIFLLSTINQTSWKRTQNAVYIGIFLGVFPPLIDLAVSGFNAPITYRYYVEGDLAHMPLHFFAPQHGAPLGEAITVWLSIAFAASYSLSRSRSWIRASLTAIAVYAFMLLQFAFLPRALVYLIQSSGSPLPADSSAQGFVAKIAISFLPFWYLILSLVFYLALKAELRSLLRRRLPHFMPFVLVTIAGGHYTGGVGVEVLLAAAAVLLLAATAAVQNDFFDRTTGSAKLRPDSCDLDFMHIVAAGLLLWLLLLGLNSVLPLMVIAAASVLYNFPQFKLRRIFPASLKIEGLWAAMAFLAGMLVYDRKSLRGEALVVLGLVFGGWSVVAAWKDLKDVRGDARHGYLNLYTFLWRRHQLSLHRVHRIVSLAVIFCFAVPIVYAAITAQWLAVGALSVLGLAPIVALSFHPGLKNWFRWVLLVFSVEILVLIFFLRL
jgi:hypothetical protein